MEKDKLIFEYKKFSNYSVEFKESGYRIYVSVERAGSKHGVSSIAMDDVRSFAEVMKLKDKYMKLAKQKKYQFVSRRL